MLRHLLAVALLACLALQAYALPTITQKGAKFFAGGQQYFLKGVAYQGTPNDPLVDTNQCQLDAKAMQSIGTNSIRVYHVDPAANHDGCMSAFSDAGIYIWLDLDTFDTYILQTAPVWSKAQFTAYAKVMDEFQKYDNLGGFWIGNEVINTLEGSASAPYIKAAVADMKAYLSAKGYRPIPVGYSAADIAELRPMLQNYLACGEPEEAIDFYGLNAYEWCGDATYKSSGYDVLQAMAQGYSLPIFFSETGCNVGGERTFNDQKAIFGSEMIDTWSGSIIYEWVEETNHYGVVTYPNGQIYSGAPISIQPDFNNLQRVWKGINPAGVSEGSYSPTFSPPACPGSSGGWTVNGNAPLPRLDPSVIKALAAGSAPTKNPTSTTTTPAPTTSSSESTGMPSSLTTSSSLSTSSSSSSISSSSVSSSSRIMPTSSSTIVSSSSTNSASSSTPTTLSSSPSRPEDSASSSQPTVTATGNPTTTGANPAATTSRSAASSLRMAGVTGLMTNVDNLGGHGGEIGLLIFSATMVLGLGAFL